MALLKVENLCVDFLTDQGRLSALENVSFSINEGEIHGLVGESGSGKSLMTLAILGLLPRNMEMRADQIQVNNMDLLRMTPHQRRQILTKNTSIIFQEPQRSLNPTITVGNQLREAIKFHEGGAKKHCNTRAIEMLDSLGVDDPELRMQQYPSQLEIGISQRVMIALALACNPKILFADEPTTALDITIQSQLLNLLFKLNKERGMSLVLITHDFSILSQNSHRITVMYSGQTIESAPTADLIESPLHPYTQAFLRSIPQINAKHQKGRRITTLRGSTPDFGNLPVGCRLGPRCPLAERTCVKPQILKNYSGHFVRCHKPIEILKE
jgi:dipeptide transport system ATP-binding protein